MVAIVWEFQVRPESRGAFETHYGPAGTWAALFRRSDAYRGTALLRDATRADSYLTIDRWEDAAAFDAFKATNRADYDAIDRQCEALTLSERRVGVFFELSSAT
jgi:quinol monooxygenase YgiN